MLQIRIIKTTRKAEKLNKFYLYIVWSRPLDLARSLKCVRPKTYLELREMGILGQQ